MENERLQGFKTFLTEHFTALAVEVFGEVESMMEACYEENKRLRNMLHMVLTPEIKLTRIGSCFIMFAMSTVCSFKSIMEADGRSFNGGDGNQES